MRKKLISLLIVLCLALSLLPLSAMAADFTDVPAGEYYAEPVKWAVEHNPVITKGTTATTFGPNETCTRAQVVTFLWRAMGAAKMYITNPFRDVPTTEYYYNSAVWAYDKNITKGTDATHFSPDAPCTRAQVATFLYRTLGEPASGVTVSPFEDVKNADEFYYKAVLWAYDKNVTAGTDDTHFSPDEPCTRAQIVTFLFRAIEDQKTSLLTRREEKTGDKVTGEIYTYDAHGNNTRTTDLDGKAWEERTFNPDGRTLTCKRSDGQSVTYTYDAAGKVTSEKYADCTVKLTADAKGNIITREYVFTDETKNHTVTCSYNAKGELLQAEDYAGETLLSREINAYDLAGKLDFRRVETWTDGELSWSDTRYTYDAKGNLVTEITNSSDGASEEVKTAYTYDRSLITQAQRTITRTAADGETTTETVTVEYTYTTLKTNLLPSAWEGTHETRFEQS